MICASADDVQMTYTSGDDVKMTCIRCVDDVETIYLKQGHIKNHIKNHNDINNWYLWDRKHNWGPQGQQGLLGMMCRQYVLSRATSGATSGTTVTCHFQQSSWIPIVFPVPKILVIDVTMVPDVVPDVALLKIYYLHIIPSCPHGPCGSQLCFLSQR